jgi:hypothetical protein
MVFNRECIVDCVACGYWDFGDNLVLNIEYRTRNKESRVSGKALKIMG